MIYMKKNIICLLSIIALIFAVVPSVFAIGLGLNVKEEPVGMPPVHGLSFSSPIAQLVYYLNGTDLVIDTAVAKNQLFNYRLNIECYNTLERKNYLFGNHAYSINRLIWANTFGFGMVRKRFIRIWVGPQVALSYEFSNTNNRIIDTYIFHQIGSVAGANFHMGETATISVEIGLRAGIGFDLKKSLSKSIFGPKIEPLAAIKLIFRAWDSFIPSGA
ncbi:MAG: hypothetical protein A2176_07265 [Spirochaetes bacterium RBG_13_51_14]|nr:MAG: hypothetical protein A2176_07265 [Spirochaetes bacterium RBG_13_51_14]